MDFSNCELSGLIDGVKEISEIHKVFYKHMINARYEQIIKDSYEKLCNRGNNNS